MQTGVNLRRPAGTVALVARDTTSITITGAKQDVTVAGPGLLQLIVR